MTTTEGGVVRMTATAYATQVAAWVVLPGVALTGGPVKG